MHEQMTEGGSFLQYAFQICIGAGFYLGIASGGILFCRQKSMQKTTKGCGPLDTRGSKDADALPSEAVAFYHLFYTSAGNTLAANGAEVNQNCRINVTAAAEDAHCVRVF